MVYTQPVDSLNVRFGTFSWWLYLLTALWYYGHDLSFAPFLIYNLCYAWKVCWISSTALLKMETDICKTEFDFELLQLVLSSLCHGWLEVAMWPVATHSVDTDHVIFCVKHCISGMNSGIIECQTWSVGIWKALVVTHFKALLWNLPGDSKDKEMKRNRGDLVWLVFELDCFLVWSGDTSAMQACTKRKFILGYCTVWSGRWLPGFQMNLLPPSSGWRMEPAHFFLARCFFTKYFVISVWCVSCFSV
jgi:hypothetical protein